MNFQLIDRAKENEDKIAIVATEGAFTYQNLLHTSARIATKLLDNVEDLQEQRV
ncbi:MAG TPA: long-chain fatty acid--CoA ligase, partial [Cyanobacteria bacterium UBA8553]|nr:long-chain fatty acid--CoA ligase [Cyanobacteria bacterium UBA8553]